jgi:hypothetical protein
VNRLLNPVLKFFSRNCGHCMATWMAAAWFMQLPVLSSHVRGTLHHCSHTVWFNLLCARCVKHSVPEVCFVCKYVVKFNAEDFHCENLYKEENYEKCHKKFRRWFPTVSVPSKSIWSESWRSFLTSTVTWCKLYNMHYMGDVASNFAISLGSDFNWTSCMSVWRERRKMCV